MAVIHLRIPFSENFPVSFAFGAIPDSEEIKRKYRQWRMVGHNGIDYDLPEGTSVLVTAAGTVIQSGDNGGFGISVTIQHLWGKVYMLTFEKSARLWGIG